MTELFNAQQMDHYEKLVKNLHPKDAARAALNIPTDKTLSLLDSDRVAALIRDVNDRKLARSSAVREHDPVNHPSHYTQYKGVEVIQLTEQMNFNRGNAVKYIARAGFKDPDKEIEDLEKALWYLAREIERKKNAEA